MTIAVPANPVLQRLKAIRELPQRRAAAAEWLRAEEASAAVTLLDALFDTWAAHGTPEIAAVLDAIIQSLGHRELMPSERLVILYRSATEAESVLVARLMFEHSPPTATENELKAQLAPERKLSPQGKPLSLGERMSLARTADREVLRRVLADPHPSVIEILCINPHCTESDILQVASRRPAVPDSLRFVADSDRWRTRYSVRRALVMNRYTPVNVAIRLSLLLRPADVVAVRDDENLAVSLRDYAAVALKRRDLALLALSASAAWN